MLVRLCLLLCALSFDRACADTAQPTLTTSFASLGGAPGSDVKDLEPQSVSTVPFAATGGGSSSDVIEITQGQVKPTPIAISAFTGDDEYAQKIMSVIQNDLTMCGRFHIINASAHIQDAESAQQGVRFEDWRMINAQILLVGSVDTRGGEVTVDFKIYDVMKGVLLRGMSLTANESKWRKLAHMVSDVVYERVTWDAGFFDSQIVFIDEQGYGRHKKRQLAIMDIDGENVHYLTDASHLVLTPRFSPSTKQIAYLKFKDNKAHVYLMDLQNKKSNLLGQFEGMTFAPRFSPDGNTVVMSLSKGHTTALFSYNLQTKEKRQLTSHDQIDTSPCYSPDGQHIVFVSDRGGVGQKLYVMRSDGSDVRQISQDAGNYTQPVWSPRGDMIVFSKKVAGMYYVGVMKTDGSEERLIDSGYLIEGAAWSPNGRYIIYTKETQSTGHRVISRLCCMDLTGLVKMELKTPHNASDPAWSPLLSSVSVSG